MFEELISGLITLLRANLDDPLSRGGKWIYPGAVRLDAQMPRIAIIQSGAVERFYSLSVTKAYDIYVDIYIYVKQGDKYTMCDDQNNCGDYSGNKLLEYYADQIHEVMDNLPATVEGVYDYPRLVGSYNDYTLINDKIVIKKMRYSIPFMDYPISGE